MITEQAKVISVQDNTVTLESMIKSGCSGCQQIDSCGSGQIAKAFPQRKACFETTCDIPVKVGDEVIIGIVESSLLKTAMQVYLSPLLGLLSFSALGQWFVLKGIFINEPMAIALGFVGGYLGYRLAKYQQQVSGDDKHLQPKILNIAPETISVTQIDPIS